MNPLDDSELPPLPTFLILGAQKSATRWLRVNLGRHPDVFTADLELSFFNQKYHRGVDFYRAQFEGWAGEPIRGEATPGYMMWRHRPARVAQRIKTTVPDVRLIALLRNPIDRAQSALVHHAKRDRVKRRASLVELAAAKPPTEDRLNLIAGGWYAASLQPYQQLFGDQLLVLLHDDIATDPLGVYRAALEHIGASPDFVPEGLSEVVYSNQAGSNRRRPKSLSDEERRELWTYYEDDVARLEEMIGRDLSFWNPNLDLQPWPDEPEHFHELFQTAWAWQHEVLSRITPDQYDLPTPCADWTVRDVILHLLIHGGMTVLDEEAPISDEQAQQVLADPAGRFDTFREFSSIVYGDPSIRRRHVRVEAANGGQGRLAPNAVLLGAALVNNVVHAWDLAVATGQDATIPPGVAAGAEQFYRELCAVDPVFRRELGDPRPYEGDDPTARLVAFMGRDPVRSRI